MLTELYFVLETVAVAEPLQAAVAEPLQAAVAEPLQASDGFDVEWTRTALLSILGYALLAGVGTLTVAFGYRAATVRRLHGGPALIAGLALPAGWLVLEAVRHGEVIANSPLVDYTSSVFLLGVLTAGTVTAAGGHRLGDHLACGVYDVRRLEADGPVADLVRSAGLVVTVTLPESIDDAEGYPTVDAAIKRDLAGRQFRFPNDCSLDELRSRTETRLESDFDVGYARVELADDGSVDAVAIGDRQDGISASLGPDRVAVAIAGDPPSQVSTGDPVEVWTSEGDESRFIATGTLRASTGPVTTLLVDADDAEAFDPGERYRLTTRPEAPSDGFALVTAIRGADEAVAVRTVDDGGPLESEFVGWVSGTVLAVERGDQVLSLPADKEPLEAGDRVHVFGTPAALEAPSTDGDPTADADEGVAETENEAGAQPSQPASVE